MAAIWRSVGKMIRQQLARGKGTRVEGLGTFTLCVKGSPAFFPDPLFAKIYGLRPHRKPIKGSTLNSSVQFCLVDKLTRGGAPRDDVEQVLAAVPHTIRWALDHEVSSIMLQVGPVGDFVIGPGPGGGSSSSSSASSSPDGKENKSRSEVVGVRFDAQFLDYIRHSMATKAPTGLGAQIDKRRRREAAESRRTVGGVTLDAAAGRAKGNATASSSSSAMSSSAMDGEKALVKLRQKVRSSLLGRSMSR